MNHTDTQLLVSIPELIAWMLVLAAIAAAAWWNLRHGGNRS